MDRLLEPIEEMRRFDGPPSEFWPAFLERSARLVEASFSVLMIRDKDGDLWKTFAAWPSKGPGSIRRSDLKERMETAADAAAARGSSPGGAGPGGAGDEGEAIGVRLDIEGENSASVAVFFMENSENAPVEEIALLLKLIADIPVVYQMGRVARQARDDVAQFAEALDLMVLLNEEKKFMAAAMTFCNEVASRYGCERVSLGWIKGAYVRVKAISHMERFEKKMDAVQKLEAVMEEAFDQDEEVLLPRPDGGFFVSRDHESYSREQGASNIVSLPIRLDNDPVAVVTCERATGPFSEEEVRGLRVLCDQSARRLGDLQRYDRWFGARLMTFVRESLAKLFGVEHTFAKLIGLLVCAALALLIFGRMEYRVEGAFSIRTEDLAFLPAPFDGYIHEVHVKVGDQVEDMAPLLSLDTRELLLEESTAVANQNRYMREAEKARAQNMLADMKIAQALEAQAQARLKLVRYHLEYAILRAPFSGIVVEGDLEELLGAPVRKGDVLFKVARIDKMYAELKVAERDIHEISESSTGEIAFVSRPDLKFPIGLERIEPVAIAEEEGNVFLVRAFFEEEEADWWRPGMTGVAKINVGNRNILWILTHRTVDFLRIFLWW